MQADIIICKLKKFIYNCDTKFNYKFLMLKMLKYV